MGFPRQEYWSELLFPPPGDLPDPGIKSESPALARRFITPEPIAVQLQAPPTKDMSKSKPRATVNMNLLRNRVFADEIKVSISR